MTVPALPDERHRWRCNHCGNLTRFDVVRTMRTREFWHCDLAGVPAVEERQILDEALESVTCRWCSSADTVELVDRP